MTRLVVVRHGRTEWNRAGRFQGHADVPLDAEGRRQARRTAAGVAAELGAGGRTAGASVTGDGAIVVSSDLARAVGTARTIAASLGASVAIDAGLREVDVGAWEGLTRLEAAGRYPDQYRLWTAGVDVRRGGGETLGEAGRRVADRIEVAVGRARSAPVVVVGHGMSLQAALGVLRDRAVVALDGEPPHLDNAGWLSIPVETADRDDAGLTGWCRLTP